MRRLLVAGLLGLAVGCAAMKPPLPTPTAAGLNPADLVDPLAEADSCGPCALHDLYRVAEMIRRERRPAVLPPKKSILVLSGGGAYGAYSAGVLVGWTRTGTRPEFDVVTGVSTGALVAALAFLGPDYDGELRRVYTTLQSKDIFRFRRSVRSLLSEGLADNAPLARQIESFVTPETVARLAAEHARGRRLYVGTTDLDGRRQVVWDIGAIATQGTPEAAGLIVKVLLASAAIPGFFPPVKIPISADGQLYEERHVDGGVTAALFFRMPWVPPEKRNDPIATSLYDSDLYIIVAGKLYPDPEPVPMRTLTIAATSVSTLIYAQTRDELVKLYTACVLTGMNYRLTAIPQDFSTTASSTDFDPAEMTRMFDEGVRQAACGAAWRSTPPGLEPGERVSQRGGVNLTVAPSGARPAPTPTAPPGLFDLRRPVTR
ncbi:MAG TPA: patatin-like phospholipase family protein [Gemmatimonadales bacterium]|nr:patatin-like phospholipase family protein [Gemmatimonadales bacterium]